MNPIVHFEIPFEEKERAIEFYRKVFGWKIQDMPEMQYVIAHTGETDEENMLKKPGMINGGMFKREKPFKGPVLTIDTSDIDKMVKEIKINGGEVLKPKFQVGDMGYALYFKDTEGNVIGLWENKKKG